MAGGMEGYTRGYRSAYLGVWNGMAGGMEGYTRRYGSRPRVERERDGSNASGRTRLANATARSDSESESESEGNISVPEPSEDGTVGGPVPERWLTSTFGMNREPKPGPARDRITRIQQG